MITTVILRGDNVIKDVAKIIIKNVRKTDFMGRYGGEEFNGFIRVTDQKLYIVKIQEKPFRKPNNRP